MLKKSVCLILMIAALSIGLAIRSGDVAAETNHENPTDRRDDNHNQAPKTVTETVGLTDVQNLAVTVTAKPTVLARAYINADRKPGFDPSVDVMIAQIVDEDKSGTVTVGDTIRYGFSPTNFDPCPTGPVQCTGTTPNEGQTEVIGTVNTVTPDTIWVYALNPEDGKKDRTWSHYEWYEGFLDHPGPGFPGVGNRLQDFTGTDPTGPDPAVLKDCIMFRNDGLGSNPKPPWVDIQRHSPQDDYFIDVHIGITE